MLERAFFDGELAFESDLANSPSPEMRARVTEFGAHSYVGYGACLGDEKIGALIGVAGFERREPTAVDCEVLKTIATLVELAFR